MPPLSNGYNEKLIFLLELREHHLINHEDIADSRHWNQVRNEGWSFCLLQNLYLQCEIAELLYM
jgi:hypothetical protein